MEHDIAEEIAKTLSIINDANRNCHIGTKLLNMLENVMDAIRTDDIFLARIRILNIEDYIKKEFGISLDK